MDRLQLPICGAQILLSNVWQRPPQRPNMATETRFDEEDLCRKFSCYSVTAEKKEIKWNFQGKHRISKLLKGLAHLAPKLGHSHHQRLQLPQPTGSTATTKISLYFSTFKIDFCGNAAHWTWKPGSVLVPCPATASATLQLEDTAPTRDKINGTHIQLC